MKKTVRRGRKSIAAYITQGFCLGNDPDLVARYHRYCRKHKVPFVCLSGKGPRRSVTVKVWGAAGFSAEEGPTIIAALAEANAGKHPQVRQNRVKAKIPADIALEVVGELVSTLRIPSITSKKAMTRRGFEARQIARFALLVEYELPLQGAA